MRELVALEFEEHERERELNYSWKLGFGGFKMGRRAVNLILRID